MTQLNLKPAHAPIKAYYDTLARFGAARFDNEGNIREAFGDLLKRCARQFDWTFVREYSARIPDIAQGALKLIAEEHRTNKTFRERFTAFANLCRLPALGSFIGGASWFEAET